MLVKQNQQEIAAAIAKMHTAILPSVLLDGNEKSTPEELARVESNANAIKAHLGKHYTDAKGVTDFSVESLRATVLALVDDLHWKVPPKNFGAKERESKRNEKNRLGMGSHKTEFDRAELNKPQKSISEMRKENAEKARVDNAVAETEKTIAFHQGLTHARTAAERNILRAERARLVTAGTDPAIVRDAIQKLEREMKPSALGS